MVVSHFQSKMLSLKNKLKYFSKIKKLNLRVHVKHPFLLLYIRDGEPTQIFKPVCINRFDSNRFNNRTGL